MRYRPKFTKNVFIIINLVMLSLLFGHKSPNPLVLERYSLSFVILGLVILIVNIFLWVLWVKFKKNMPKILLMNLLVLFFTGFIFEVLFHIYAFIKPTYKVLWFYPNKYVGWTFPPGEQYEFAGDHWYEREFRFDNKFNLEGFRDKNHFKKKNKEVRRIALLGDSLIAARQVALEDTAGKVLEDKLNSTRGQKFEVLNFGVDGYGTGQALLVFDKYASKYKPDYTFILIFHLHLWRSIGARLCGDSGCYHARPVFYLPEDALAELRDTFHLNVFHKFIEDIHIKSILNPSYIISEDEYENIIVKQLNEIRTDDIEVVALTLDKYKLHHVPARGYDKFLKSQKEYILNNMNGNRAVKYKHKFYFQDWFFQINKSLRKYQNNLNQMKSEMKGLKWVYKSNLVGGGNSNYPLFENVIFNNLKLIDILGKSIKDTTNGKLIIVDMFNYNGNSMFRRGGGERFPRMILNNIYRKFASIRGYGYIPLGLNMHEAEMAGKSVHWKYDNHFNVVGNKIFGKQMYNWVINNEIK